ncbi:MAG: hypothetical protein JRE23_15425 [Deltaproteobacteria bacterium]|nr:hypothetical protein [Deltaproteobacteria bacterium]
MDAALDEPTASVDQESAPLIIASHGSTAPRTRSSAFTRAESWKRGRRTSLQAPGMMKATVSMPRGLPTDRASL